VNNKKFFHKRTQSIIAVQLVSSWIKC